MATDFAVSLRRFLTGHLAGLRGYSTNTIVSYRDAFKLLICYFRDQRSTPPERGEPPRFRIPDPIRSGLERRMICARTA